MEAEGFFRMSERLRAVGIPVTLQRLEIARVLLNKPVHLSADQVLVQVRQGMPETSRATVYNTLKLFREKGLIKEVIADPERVMYDSNTLPHHHIYDVDTGTLVDLPGDQLLLGELPALPSGMQVESVDIIVRVRSGRH
jgi:Fur family iron response transcriptional regulator